MKKECENLDLCQRKNNLKEYNQGIQNIPEHRQDKQTGSLTGMKQEEEMDENEPHGNQNTFLEYKISKQVE